MTQKENSDPGSGAQESKAQAAREQTSNVGRNAVHAGGDVARTAGEQGKNVAAETGRQARHLLDEATTRLRERADAQQKRTAEGLRSLADELQSMASHSERQTPATDMVRRASGTAQQAADWLQHREPGDVVNELREYARRHPGLFLAGAVVAGVLSGRMTRSLTAAGGSQPDGKMQAAPTPDEAPGPVIGAAGDGRDNQPAPEPGSMPAESNRAEVRQ
jgi:hypothetical protein